MVMSFSSNATGRGRAVLPYDRERCSIRHEAVDPDAAQFCWDRQKVLGPRAQIRLISGDACEPKAGLARTHDRLCAVWRAELAKNAVNVVADGFLAQRQRLRYL